MNVSLPNFHQVLQKMANSDLKLSVEQNRLVYSQNIPKKPMKTAEAETFLKFFEQASSNFSKQDVPSLQKIEAKIIQDTTIDPTLKQKIKKKFDQHILKAKASGKDRANSSNPEKVSVEVLFKVASTPRHSGDFLRNLYLIADQSPRYSFGNDLAVYDTQSGVRPETDPVVIFDEFTRFCDRLDPKFKADEALAATLEKMQELLRPRKVVSMHIANQPSSQPDDLAMKCILRNQLNDHIPIILSRNLFQDHYAYLENCDLLKDRDIYIQPNRSLMLILPQNQTPESQGFTPIGENLIKWTEPYDQLPMASGEFSTDLNDLLMEDQKKQGFLRLVNWASHGLKEKVIANLPVPEFQKSMQVLENKHTEFLFLASCFSGGTNASYIHTPDGRVPFPTLLNNATDSVTLFDQDINFKNLLDNVQSRLFKTQGNKANAAVIERRHLTKSDMSQISKLARADFQAFNVGTILLPTPLIDVPKVAYTPSYDEAVDLSNILKTQKNAGDFSEEIRNDSRGALYLFSEPTLPITLKCPYMIHPFLMSRGGNAQHLIKAIEMPMCNLEHCAKNTFNFLNYLELPSNTAWDIDAFKVFAVGRMRCKFEFVPQDLENVVFIITPTERKLIFRFPGSDEFYLIHFNRMTEAPFGWLQAEPQKITTEAAVCHMFLGFLESKSDTEHLSKVAPTRDSNQDFFEQLNPLFWNNSPPLLSRFLTSIYMKNHTYIRPEGELPVSNKVVSEVFEIEECLGEIEQLRGSLENDQLRHSIIDYALFFLDNESKLPVSEAKPIIEACLQCSQSLLMRAVLNNDLESIETLLSENPNQIHDTDMRFNTALHYAIQEHHDAAASVLLTKGASLNTVNFFGKTPLILAIEEGREAVAELLADKVLNVQDDAGNTPLHYMMMEKNIEVAKWLLKKGAKVDIPNNEGKTPLQLASKMQNKELVRLAWNNQTSDL